MKYTYGNLDDNTVLSLVVAQITHSPFAIAKNVHGAFTKQSLRYVGIPAAA